MPIVIESRQQAERVQSAAIWMVPDGTAYGEGAATSGKDAQPTLEEAKKVGKFLGTLAKWRVQQEFKTLTKMGANPDTQRYESRDIKILDKVKVLFSSQDVVPEAVALEWGMEELPAVGEAAKPFVLGGGTMRGWLYVETYDHLRTHGEDGNMAEVVMRGDLGLADTPEHTNELDTYNWEFMPTVIPADGFKNVGLESLS